MIVWLLGTRLGRLLSAAVAGAAALFGVYAIGRRDGGQRAKEKAREADQARAKDIEERVDEALRNHDDSGDVDDRLRERGRLRD